MNTHERLEERRRRERIGLLRIALFFVLFILVMASVQVYRLTNPPIEVQAGVSCKPPNTIPARQNSNDKCGCTNEHGLANGWTEDASCGESAPVVVTQPPVVVIETVKVIETVIVEKPTHTASAPRTVQPRPTDAIIFTEVADDDPSPTLPGDPKMKPTPYPSPTFPPKNERRQVRMGPTVGKQVTRTPVCDLCLQEERQADALERIANAVEGILGWFKFGGQK